jgi:hypothetical protein
MLAASPSPPSEPTVLTALIDDAREHADWGENNPVQPMPWSAVVTLRQCADALAALMGRKPATTEKRAE